MSIAQARKTDVSWKQADSNSESLKRQLCGQDWVGPPRVINELWQTAQSSSSPVWLLSGPKGIGKATLALRLAIRLAEHGPRTPPSTPHAPPAPFLGKTLTPSDPGVAPLIALSHPDVLYVRTGLSLRQDKSTPTTVIGVESIREMLKSASIRPRTDQIRRCLIIDGAEQLHPTATDALLKTLEEPSDGICFLLISHAPHQLRATLLSRVIHVQIPPLSFARTNMLLSTLLPKHQTQTLSWLSGGSPGLALDLQAQQAERFVHATADLICGNLDPWNQLERTLHQSSPTPTPDGRLSAIDCLVRVSGRVGQQLIYAKLGLIKPGEPLHDRIPALRFWSEGNLISAVDGMNRQLRLILPPTLISPALALQQTAQDMMNRQPSSPASDRP